VKVSVRAHDLAAALSSSAAALDPRAKIDALGFVYLKVHEDRATITANGPDWTVTVPVAAEIGEVGEVAIAGKKFADLVAAIPFDETIELESSDAFIVKAGRSRYRLPTMAVADMPPMLALAGETGKVVLNREAALDLFTRPLVAVDTDRTRYYLGGVFLHASTDETLSAVATDGHRLVKITIAARPTLTRDRRLIVPAPAAKLIAKYLRRSRSPTVTVRRNARLVEADTGICLFISKLIDADFVAYEKIIPATPANRITVNRAELAQAVERLVAVAREEPKCRAAVLQWSEGGALHLTLVDADGTADDVINAVEAVGTGRTVLGLRYLSELLHEIEGDRVALAVSDRTAPVLFTDPDDERLLVVQSPIL
jgi:DNA polymerase-3 subunit beta